MHPGTITLVSPPANDVKALFQLLDKPRNIGRVMLEVSIHGDDVITARRVKAGAQGDGFARVMAQSHDRDPAIYLGNLLQEGQAAVCASIVHKHALKRMPNRVQRLF